MLRIRRALLSVWDKTGIVDLARTLHQLNVKIIASSGTTKALKAEGIPATELSTIINHPEILGGRVKSLHPAVHGAILADKKDPAHMTRLKQLNIQPIDLVVVNLYPFEAEQDLFDIEKSLEFMDIGGNTLLRAAAKNFRNVAVLTSPDQYIPAIQEMSVNGGALSRETLLNFAVKAVSQTSRYDLSILEYLGKYRESHAFDKTKDAFTALPKEQTAKVTNFPRTFVRRYEKVSDLRYGENPHQKSALYKELSDRDYDCSIITHGQQLQGKQLSYNNYVDMDGAVKIAMDFREPTAVVIKHTNPCGLATDTDILSAYKVALSTDPKSAFGGVIGLNRKVCEATAKEIITSFKEAVVAPDYEPQALAVFRKKKNLRIIKLDFIDACRPELNTRSLCGGIVLQDSDRAVLEEEDLTLVSKRKPTPEMMKSLLFARKVVKHVKSNAIVYVKGTRTIGIGAGQMSRVDSARIAAFKAKEDNTAGESTVGAVMASDAFFPFRDGIDAANEAGIVAVIQPGGSIRDKQVIDAVDEHDMVMVFTGKRCFNH